MTRGIDIIPPPYDALPVIVASTLCRVSLFVFVAICLFAVLSPFSPGMPEFGLDPSWRAVLGELPRLGLRTGQNVIFTGGPLSPLYTQWFDADRFSFYLWLQFALIL